MANKKETPKKDRHCSDCKYYWCDIVKGGNGSMYCEKLQHRITAGRRNGCKFFERNS